MNNNGMNNHRNEPGEHEEPVILSFEAFKKGDVQPGNHPDDQPPQTTDEGQPQGDDFWAGRNLAMRRSARWAA